MTRLRFPLFAAALAAASALTAHAQVSYNGGVYSQSFDALPGTTNNALDQTWTNNTTLPGWYASKATFNVTDGTIGGTAAAFDSTATAANVGLFSFGTAGSTDRALGSRATSQVTGNAPVLYGVRLVNNTNRTITSFTATYTGEQWFASTQSAAHTLLFDYQLGATALDAGTWTAATAGTFTAPISTGTTARSLDGNATANRTPIAVKVTGISWAPGQELWLRFRDENDSGNEQGLSIDDFSFIADSATGLYFNGSSSCVTMGYGSAAAPLNASSFTVECRFMRTGPGTTATSGNGGVIGNPLVTKGVGESEGTNVDADYFLGIDAAGHLVADFEQLNATNNGTARAAGQNFPVTGSTLLQNGVFYHVAATYDTTTAKWNLYVNGVAETLTTVLPTFVGVVPRNDNIQGFGIGTAINSTGIRTGNFNGIINEVRVWNYARSASEIIALMNTKLTTGATGLLGRYGLDEGTGTTVAGINAANTAAPAGTLSGTVLPTWVNARAFSDNTAPAISLTAPTNGATVTLPAAVNLAATATDTDGSVVRVDFYSGATKIGTAASAPYTFAWTPAEAGTYTLTAVATDDAGATATSGSATVTVAANPNQQPAFEPGRSALKFDGVNDYVTMGVASQLNAGGPPSNGFTLECWFRRDAAGKTTTSGSGGVTGVPLFGKGRGEAENSNVDCNYFFGINTSGQLVADFEAYPASGITAGQNYPITGTNAAIVNNTWYHAAVTYDGPSHTWTMYLNGVQVGTATAAANALPRYDSIQHFGVGAAFTSDGTADGAFAGSIDEVRVWNYARSPSEIVAGRDTEIGSAPGLVGRYGFNEATGTTTANSAREDQLPTGTLVNGPVWSDGPSFSPNVAPTVVLTAPSAGSVMFPAPINFAATAADSDGTIARVEFYDGATKVGQATASPYTFAWNSAPIGTHTLTAVAVDDREGRSEVSSSVTVEVIPNPDKPPVVTPSGPAAGATGIGNSTTLSVGVADPEHGGSTVTFYGRKTTPVTPGPDFSIATLPDTQFYSENLNNNNRAATYYAQTQWLLNNRDSAVMPHLAFVSHMGDLVQDGDSVPAQWLVADGAMKVLENAATAFRAYGIPWGGAPGNHDQTVNGSAGGANAGYNQYFSATRYAGRNYWGGSQSTLNNHNNYQLFSASGLDFIIIHMEYDTRALSFYQPVLDWADALMKAYPNRRAIVTSHWIVNTGNPATFSTQGKAIYDALKNNPNFMLMLCGHVDGEGQRADVYQGRTVYSILQDYQGRSNGGDGWLRYFVFSPAANTLTAKTYKVSNPVNRSASFETDADSSFVLPFNLQSSLTDWIPLGTATVAAGDTTAGITWSGLEKDSDYEWYSVVNDGVNTVTSDTRRFTTVKSVAPVVSLTAPSAGAVHHLPGAISLAATASDSDGTVAKVEFFNGGVKLGEATEAPYTFSWTNPTAGNCALSAVATDNEGRVTLSNIVNVTVAATGEAPTVTLTSPTSADSTLQAGTITLTATAADSDGTVAKVEFFDGANFIGSTTTSPYSYAWTNAAAGSYALTAKATDNDGNVTTSPAVNILVNVPAPASGTLQRGPYLNMGNQNSIVIRWRSSQSTLGRVRYGTSTDSLTQFTDETAQKTDHEVRLTGLTPYTRYYYSVGSPVDVLTPETADTTTLRPSSVPAVPVAADYTFRTSPLPGTATDTRIWVVGDCGRGSAAQAGGRDAYLTWMGNRVPDLNLQLGDNAYNSGTDTEYQTGYFLMYPSLFRKIPQWSTLGNHDANNGTTNPTTNFPYFDMFTFPTAGEAGGVASGSEHYYSFDYGNIHFICLDSQASSTNTIEKNGSDGPMAAWLRQDLAATTSTWIIAFWHHPPYSKGSHDSDSESQMVNMRTNFNPILEAGGVDLVFNGHSHTYERSVLLDGHYGISSTITSAMKINAGNGSTTGITTGANGMIRRAPDFTAVATVNGTVIPADGAYIKPLTGPRDHFGAVYNTAGMSGQADGGALNHTAMYLSYNTVGTVNVDVNGNTLVATYVQAGGTAPDNFTIVKQGAADSDGDGIPDDYEIANGLNRTSALDADLDLDGDGLSNRLEYALGTAANVPSRSGLPVLGQGAGSDAGKLTLTFTRARSELTYTVQASDDLKVWSDVASNPGSVGASVTVTDANTASANRYLRLKITDGVATETTTPAGRMLFTLAQGQDVPVAFPLTRAIGPITGQPAGFITATGASTLDNSAAGWSAGALSQAATPYLVRITSGAAAGLTLPVSTTTANTATRLTLVTSGIDLTALGIVAGQDSYELIPADTLDTLFPTGTLKSGADTTTADSLRMWNGSTWIYYFNNGTGWQRYGAGAAANILVRPDRGWIMKRVGATTAFTLFGQVSSTAERTGIARGANTFVSTLPVSATFDELALQTALPAWSSNTVDPTVGDHVRIWSGSTWLIYFHDPVAGWKRYGAGAAGTTVLSKPGRPFLVVRPAGTGTDLLLHAKSY